MKLLKNLINPILKTILFFIGWSILISLTPDIKGNNPAYLRLWWEFSPFIAVLLFSFVFSFIIDKGKNKIPVFKNFSKNLFRGVILGLFWLGSVVLILSLTRTMVIQGSNSISLLWVWILASFFNVIMQELLVRGYLYQLWKQKYNVFVATIVTTSLFTLVHGGAFEAGFIAVINVVSTSILLTVLLEYTESIIAPIMAHFIWNTIGSIVLGGVSLASDYPNLFNSVFKGNTLLSGGNYKIEGSIIVLVVNIILILCFYLLSKKKKAS